MFSQLKTKMKAWLHSKTPKSADPLYIVGIDEKKDPEIWRALYIDGLDIHIESLTTGRRTTVPASIWRAMSQRINEFKQGLTLWQMN